MLQFLELRVEARALELSHVLVMQRLSEGLYSRWSLFVELLFPSTASPPALTELADSLKALVRKRWLCAAEVPSLLSHVYPAYLGKHSTLPNDQQDQLPDGKFPLSNHQSQETAPRVSELFSSMHNFCDTMIASHLYCNPCASEESTTLSD